MFRKSCVKSHNIQEPLKNYVKVLFLYVHCLHCYMVIRYKKRFQLKLLLILQTHIERAKTDDVICKFKSY